jgi:hypothetical protein
MPRWFDMSDPNDLALIIFEVACEHPYVSDVVCWEMAGDAAKAIRHRYDMTLKDTYHA